MLSACFYQPEKDFFSQERLFENLASSLQQVSPDATVFVREMEKSFLKCSEKELNVDYAKLFVGPNGLLAPPYGSVYLDGSRIVMGDSTMEVIKFYAEQGLVMDGDFNNLPDHITVELEFIQYLIFKEIESLEKSDIAGAIVFINQQQLFLDKFLKPWIQPFCDKMKEGASSEFYRALADCTCAFIKDACPGDVLPEEPGQ